MITVQNLIKHYEFGMVKALNGVSFSVAKGEIVSIMGPSGCGKSTLLNLVGILDMPTGGNMWIDGKPAKAYLPFEEFRARNIGFAFQFHHLIPSLTLLENVELPLYPLRIGRKARRQRAERILAELGLASRIDFFPGRVSGGERQRAAVARALVNEPRLVLADEPTGNLDTETGERILESLLTRCRRDGTTVLLATHNHEIAAKTNRIIRMKNGRVEDPAT